eukprot:scaffold24472_cov63-Phaeocystis_antarctica.AAC.1
MWRRRPAARAACLSLLAAAAEGWPWARHRCTVLPPRPRPIAGCAMPRGRREAGRAGGSMPPWAWAWGPWAPWTP